MAAIGVQAIGFSSLFTNDALTMGVGPAFHLPIFDAGRIRAQYARATADLDGAVADYNGAVLGAVRDTADALTQVAQPVRPARRAAEGAGQRHPRIEAGRGTLTAWGLSDQIPMLTAEATLLTARQQMAALAAQSASQRITPVAGGRRRVYS